jgi:hypothetical protein
MRRIILPALLATLALAPAAHAAGTIQIIRDCADDGVLNGNYTLAELRHAAAHLPTDVDEYSDCRDILSRAIAAKTQSSGGDGGGGPSGPTGGSGSGGSGGAATATATPPPNYAADAPALKRAAAEGASPVKVDGRDIAPGAPSLAAAHNPLPGSMVAVLVLLAATLLAAIAPFLRRYVRPRPPA